MREGLTRIATDRNSFCCSLQQKEPGLAVELLRERGLVSVRK
jgi:hypothetical protein